MSSIDEVPRESIDATLKNATKTLDRQANHAKRADSILSLISDSPLPPKIKNAMINDSISIRNYRYDKDVEISRKSTEYLSMQHLSGSSVQRMMIE